MHDDRREGFRTVSKLPPPGALSRAWSMLVELMSVGPAAAFDSWLSVAAVCDTGWLSASRRPSVAASRVVRRRLSALASPPLSFSTFAARRSGEGPIHLRGTCAALPGRDEAAMLWWLETGEDADLGRVLIEEGNDFLLSVEGGGVVYVLSKGGHLVSSAPLCVGDAVSVFGFADAIPDAIGLASSPSGRGGLVPAIRSGADLPLLLAHVVR